MGGSSHNTVNFHGILSGARRRAVYASHATFPNRLEPLKGTSYTDKLQGPLPLSIGNHRITENTEIRTAIRKAEYSFRFRVFFVFRG